jgi:hypothetical protein
MDAVGLTTIATPASDSLGPRCGAIYDAKTSAIRQLRGNEAAPTE